VVLVRDEQGPRTAAAITAELAGLRTVDPLHVPDEPWDLSAADLVVLVDGVDPAAPERGLLDYVLRGTGAIVGVTSDARLTPRLLDALQRMAPVVDWRASPTMRLDAEQIHLLHALATGTSARAAARAIHVSERTAHRRIADARETLSAPTTNAAAADLLSVVRVWDG
jgi:DNA-binding NarL/FixJ family response regulator